MLSGKILDNVTKHYPILTAAKQLDLILSWKNTGEKRYLDELILSNMKLVISETYKLGKNNNHISHDDLFQEGLAGLLKAAEKFDASKDANFITYALWWVKAYQKRYVMDSRSLVRLGTTRDGRIMFSNLARARMKAEEMGLTGASKIKKISEIIGVDEKSIEDMISTLSGYDKSLDVPVGEDKDVCIVDTLVDENSLNNEDYDDSFSGKLKLAIKILPEDEKFIIENRYLKDSQMTLRDIADELSISREWVRKLEIRGLERMRKYLAREHNITTF